MQGTGKLHYVSVRVFRTLLSKGLCSDETEEGEGEGEGDIEGMKVTILVKVVLVFSKDTALIVRSNHVLLSMDSCRLT